MKRRDFIQAIASLALLPSLAWTGMRREWAAPEALCADSLVYHVTDQDGNEVGGVLWVSKDGKHFEPLSDKNSHYRFMRVQGTFDSSIQSLTVS